MRTNVKGIFILIVILILFVIVIFVSAERAKKVDFQNPYSVEDKTEDKKDKGLFDTNYIEETPTETLNRTQTANKYFYVPTQSGNRVVITEVVEDSRCPIGVNCVWEGTVKARVMLYIDGKIKEEILMLNTPHLFNGKTVTMIQAGPKGNYDFKFKIE